VGITFVTLEVANVSDPDHGVSMELLVDSGATYSVVPEPTLTALGIRPLSEQEFRLTNGEKISRKKGGAVFRLGERVGVADVIFGETGDQNLLGAFTLEALGLSLDPLRRELHELPMLL
jgi:predicted aspartyl protease